MLIENQHTMWHDDPGGARKYSPSTTTASSTQNPLQVRGAFMHDLFSDLQAQTGQAPAAQGEATATEITTAAGAPPYRAPRDVIIPKVAAKPKLNRAYRT